MSYDNFIKATKLMVNCKNYRNAGGVSDIEITKSEKMLGISFSKQNYEFYSKFGCASFKGFEVFGVFPDRMDVLEGNSVAYALYDRQHFNLSPYWIPVFNFDDGVLAYLDYSSLNEFDEPRVIVAYYDGEQYVIDAIIAEDFGDFLYGLVAEDLT